MKGRASAAYERAMLDLECTSDDTWHTLLQDVLVRYVKLLTNPEGPAPSAPTLTRKEIIEHPDITPDICHSDIIPDIWPDITPDIWYTTDWFYPWIGRLLVLSQAVKTFSRQLL